MPSVARSTPTTPSPAMALPSAPAMGVGVGAWRRRVFQSVAAGKSGTCKCEGMREKATEGEEGERGRWKRGESWHPCRTWVGGHSVRMGCRWGCGCRAMGMRRGEELWAFHLKDVVGDHGGAWARGVPQRVREPRGMWPELEDDRRASGTDSL